MQLEQSDDGVLYPDMLLLGLELSERYDRDEPLEDTGDSDMLPKSVVTYSES